MNSITNIGFGGEKAFDSAVEAAAAANSIRCKGQKGQGTEGFVGSGGSGGAWNRFIWTVISRLGGILNVMNEGVSGIYISFTELRPDTLHKGGH